MNAGVVDSKYRWDMDFRENFSRPLIVLLTSTMWPVFGFCSHWSPFTRKDFGSEIMWYVFWRPRKLLREWEKGELPESAADFHYGTSRKHDGPFVQVNKSPLRLSRQEELCNVLAHWCVEGDNDAARFWWFMSHKTKSKNLLHVAVLLQKLVVA